MLKCELNVYTWSTAKRNGQANKYQSLLARRADLGACTPRKICQFAIFAIDCGGGGGIKIITLRHLL